MSVDSHDRYDDYPGEPSELDARLQRIEGELEDHLPEDQRLQSSIPGGCGFSDFAYPTVHEAAYEEPRRRPEHPEEHRSPEPSFADFYEPGVADVDPDEVLGRNRRAAVQPARVPMRKSSAQDSLRQILADLGAAPEDMPVPPPDYGLHATEGREAVDAGMDEGLLELQPDELLESAGPEQSRWPSFSPIEADFLRQSGLTDASRSGGLTDASRSGGLVDASRGGGSPPATPPPAPAATEEMKNRLRDLPPPEPQGDLDKALAMARSLEKTGPMPPPEPQGDLEAVQAYLEALQGQIKPSPESAVAPPAVAAKKRPVLLNVALALLGTALFVALLGLAYLLGTGALRFD